MNSIAFLLLLSLVYMLNNQFIFVNACKKVTMIMTHASGQMASYGGSWSVPNGPANANLQNINGAFQYIITNAIDNKTGYQRDPRNNTCSRKNGINYIHFYKISFCNSDESLWWFNQRRAGYGGDKGSYSTGEFGKYLTFDQGQCKDPKYCPYLNGEKNNPDLKDFVGYFDSSKDPRNPTEGAYWFSLPGDCPLKKWDAKANCNVKGGLCSSDKSPDGKSCTWTYELMGQVVLDELVGISHQEYCKEGKKEFEWEKKDGKVVGMKTGLTFWDKPLSQTANEERVKKLLEAYKKGANNQPLPSESDLLKLNPKCYESAPGCATGTKSYCFRDDSMVCKRYEEKSKFDRLSSTEAKRVFPQLDNVKVPHKASSSSASDACINRGKGSIFVFFFVLLSAFLL